MRLSVSSLTKVNPIRFFPALHGHRLTLAGVLVAALSALSFGALTLQSISANQAVQWNYSSASGGEVKQLPPHYLFSLIGKELYSETGSHLGQIAGVLFDAWGQPRAAIVNIGGFLGIGVRQVALDWEALRFSAAGREKVFLADLDPQQLAQAPQYKAPNRPVPVVTPSAPATGQTPQSGP